MSSKYFQSNLLHDAIPNIDSSLMPCPSFMSHGPSHSWPLLSTAFRSFEKGLFNFEIVEIKYII